jgi:predicted ester cyclase
MIALSGFDAEFQSLEQYIRVITERIWEGRRIDDIYTYYTDPCVVETPSSVTSSVEDVVKGTRATLAMFPDRRLLCEDVIGFGDAARGYYSSHRIISPMTHVGDGIFGIATGAKVQVRTIADCWCIHNRIAHEWLVRDQSAIARAIGVPVVELAQSWLTKTNSRFAKPIAPPAPPPYRAQIAQTDLAQRYADFVREVWLKPAFRTYAAIYDSAVHAVTPAETHRYGEAAMESFWRDFTSIVTGAQCAIEHAIEEVDQRGVTRTALRWRVKGRSAAGNPYGERGGQSLEIMGISHAEWRDGRVLREWVLIDEVALAMQILSN